MRYPAKPGIEGGVAGLGGEAAVLRKRECARRIENVRDEVDGVAVSECRPVLHLPARDAASGFHLQRVEAGVSVALKQGAVDGRDGVGPKRPKSPHIRKRAASI